jgi:hypothetical protein
MSSSVRKSIALGQSASDRVFRSYADWQAEQARDERTPAERGIQVGGSVMWRHERNNVIVTDRAIVTAIDGHTLTITVKDVKDYTKKIHVREVVDNRADDSAAAIGKFRRAEAESKEKTSRKGITI